MKLLLTVLMTAFICPLLLAAEAGFPSLSPVQLQWLGERIYANECNRQPACLTSWNPGEDFPSLGIGHFIWYRAGQTEIYTETFPALIRYLDAQGLALPGWLRDSELEQPWPDRQAFLAAQGGAELSELRTLLANSLVWQTAFIVQRFHTAVPDILAAAAPAQRAALEQQLLGVAMSQPPRGLYALIDYVHFKGEGTSASERYQAQGWGLLQVLEAMPPNPVDPVHAFADAADTILTRRVANAPPERDEQRWLAGWRNRLNTYRNAP